MGTYLSHWSVSALNHRTPSSARSRGTPTDWCMFPQGQGCSREALTRKTISLTRIFKNIRQTIAT